MDSFPNLLPKFLGAKDSGAGGTGGPASPARGSRRGVPCFPPFAPRALFPSTRAVCKEEIALPLSLTFLPAYPRVFQPLFSVLYMKG